MSRWIDADALKATIPKTHIDMFENCQNCNLLDAEEIKTLIDEAPSIDIVRCKECKHWLGFCRCIDGLFEPNDDDYCSYGERRE